MKSTLFIIFKELSVAKNCLRPRGAPFKSMPKLPEISGQKYMKLANDFSLVEGTLNEKFSFILELFLMDSY